MEKEERSEVAARVLEIMPMIEAGFQTRQILAAPNVVAWGVNVRTVANYIRRAKAEYAKISEPRKKELRGLQLARLESGYQRCRAAGEESKALDHLKEISKTFDLYPATKTEVTGKDGGPIEVSDVRDRLAARIAALAAAGEENSGPEQPERQGS